MDNHTKNKNIPIWGMIPEFGSEYLKLKTGDFVKWTSFCKETQMVEVTDLTTGKTSKVRRQDVESPTPNEVADFLAAKK